MWPSQSFCCQLSALDTSENAVLATKRPVFFLEHPFLPLASTHGLLPSLTKWKSDYFGVRAPLPGELLLAVDSQPCFSFVFNLWLLAHLRLLICFLKLSSEQKVVLLSNPLARQLRWFCALFFNLEGCFKSQRKTDGDQCCGLLGNRKPWLSVEFSRSILIRT